MPHDPTSAARRALLRIDAREAAGLGVPVEIAVELLIPAGERPELLFVCIPGGGMNRRYFDLPTPPDEARVSFAEAMVARGHAVALIDPIGVGDSTLPDDPYTVHPDRMAAANIFVTRHLLEGLRAGNLVEGVSGSPDIRSIGVGHSFGALLTIVQQAAEPLHAAVAILGFHTGGLTEHLTEADLALDPPDARARLVEIARERFPKPVIQMEAPPSKRPVSAASASDKVLMTASLMAMLPEMVTPDAAAIGVPVLIGIGDADLHRHPHRMPAAYSGSHDVTLIVLAETRHNHFIYPSRTLLFDRLAKWAEAL